MKKIKMFIAVITAAIYAAACTITAKADTYCGTLNYIICNDTAVITGFEGSPEILCIPAFIDGKPVAEIRENAFYKCETLEKITIPESVEKIGHHAFFECGSLETAVISGSVRNIEEGCFYGCTSMETIEFPDTLKSVEPYAFYNCCNIKEINIPDSTVSIGEYAFADCRMLENVNLSDNLYELNDCAFLRCSSLESIDIPDSVISIGRCAAGFEGDIKPVPVDNFTVYGSENSLGRNYAEENGMNFVCTEETSEKTKSDFPAVPAVMVLVSGMGLMFFRWGHKILLLENKYEYEQ